MFRKMRNRILLLNMAILTIVIVAAFSSIYMITSANIQEKNDHKLDGVRNDASQYSPKNVTLLSFDVNQEGDILDASFDDYASGEFFLSAYNRIQSTGADTGVFTLDGAVWQFKVMADVSGLRDENSSAETENESFQELISAPDVSKTITLLDITEDRQTLNRLLLTFIAVGFCVFVILFGVSFFFANKSIHPLMLSWEKQRQFISDASHELKTPLTIISANNEALKANGNETVDSQHQCIAAIEAETQRMNKLVSDLLYLSRFEDMPAKNDVFSLSDLVIDIVLRIEVLMYEKELELSVDVEESILVNCDKERMQQALYVLIDNAIKYVDDRKTIGIALRRHANKAYFEVHNTYPVIPAENLSRLFDRFYRMDTARSPESDSYGLGLPIAKAIVEKAKGELAVQSTKDGVTFTITLKAM